MSKLNESKLQGLTRIPQAKPYYTRETGLKGKVVKGTTKKRLGEDRSTLPWRIQLLVQPSEILTGYIPVIYYVRGQNPNVACTMAHQLWQKWEKFDKGIVSAYPDIVEMGYAECVDEDDFRKALKDVQKYQLECRIAGTPEDPMAFTCIGRTDL